MIHIVLLGRLHQIQAQFFHIPIYSLSLSISFFINAVECLYVKHFTDHFVSVSDAAVAPSLHFIIRYKFLSYFPPVNTLYYIYEHCTWRAHFHKCSSTCCCCFPLLILPSSLSISLSLSLFGFIHFIFVSRFMKRLVFHAHNQHYCTYIFLPYRLYRKLFVQTKQMAIEWLSVYNIHEMHIFIYPYLK